MERHDRPMESWEWNGLRAYFRDEARLRQLQSAIEVERLIRQARFLLRSGLLANLQESHALRASTSPGTETCTVSVGFEHRLVSLFAE